MSNIDLAQHETSTMVGWPNGSSSSQPSGEKGRAGLDVLGEIHALLGRIGESQLEPVVYDTAWIARLGQIDPQLSTKALAWLRIHQLEDGSWGALTPLYHHDRVISTLAAITTLVRNNAPEDQPRVQAALPALQYSLANLDKDVAGRTVAFEMLLPSLVGEARALGLTIDDPDGLVAKMSSLRDAKLANAPKGLISRYSTMGHSAEMVGVDGLHLLDVDNLQQTDGSVCSSPAATAFFVTHVRPDPAALQYLHRITRDGGAPAITPVENFERGWGLWNIVQSGVNEQRLLPSVGVLLDQLEAAWHPHQGMPVNKYFYLEDGDDTAVTTELCARDGRATDLDALLSFEDQSHFRSYVLESHSSVTTNIHFLAALRHSGMGLDYPAVQKIITYLCNERNEAGFWTDKWHSSPYYATSHAVIACTGYADDLIDVAVEWIMATQDEEGAWGFLGQTAEETAYCLQALMTWHKYGYAVPKSVMARGAAWLAAHTEAPYPPLWIHKTLYCPTLIVQSAILGALWQYENEFGAIF